MPKLGIITGKAVSLQNVANDIAKVFNDNGVESMVFTEKVPYFKAKRMFDSAIIFMVFDPLYVPTYALRSVEYTRAGIKNVMYLDVAGKPKEHLVRDWLKEKITYVSNSKFSASMLMEVGLNIKEVIYHGIDLDMVNEVYDEAKELNEDTKSDMGVEVLFGTVCTNHQKKNLRGLSQAIRMVTDKIDNAGFIVVSKPEASVLFKGIKNCIFDDSMGKMPRLESLALIGSFDFLIHPSVSEGFGLPVLECQAFGVPPIHGDFNPLNEISHPDASFRVPISRIEMNSFEEGVFYMCHIYEPEALAKQIENAYITYVERKGDYNEMQEIAKENASKFDAKKVYRAFEKYLL